MLAHFPRAQKDELLTSLLARFIQQVGIKDDKVALDVLFDSRMVVPSPFLQGHIKQLTEQVGHIWHIHPKTIIERYTLLPLFRPFLPSYRYKMLQTDLLHYRTNLSTVHAGISASVINWPISYKICPQCWLEQQSILGYTYWQRLFQSPGVSVCPTHGVSLLDTEISIHSPHRHRFVGTSCYQCPTRLSEVATSDELNLAIMVEKLLYSKIDYVSPRQWTHYYQQLARDVGAMNGARIDHRRIAVAVRKAWSEDWLSQQGLALSGENTWLVAMFRKHRRMFSYLQHFIVWLSLRKNSIDLHAEFNQARSMPSVNLYAVAMNTTKNVSKRDEYRREWLRLITSLKGVSLKQVRATILGRRIFSWLYRYDSEWLGSHKPLPLYKYKNKRVNWHKRDLQLVRALLGVKNKADNELKGPRHSKSWFTSNASCKSLIEKKLHKLPLCSLFFDRYIESVEEYQTRRLCRVMVQLIEHKDIKRPVCEIERLAGLSRQRSRKPAREVLRLDIPAWQRAEIFS
ncbi:TnsD family Tn7-like transposition protein [Vibrio alginolyticus]|uniref:Transcriptional antiterminator n=1 Tax=Vibrio alginolyticus TaxID=663 RepID=A0A7Y4EYV3_VIBAL|nr:TnsD family Tn7-like transposition protein [Vibrio alginolyticus]NOI09145.1 transcriptional antiterminator [Vibrio alginolyticus]